MKIVRVVSMINKSSMYYFEGLLNIFFMLTVANMIFVIGLVVIIINDKRLSCYMTQANGR